MIKIRKALEKDSGIILSCIQGLADHVKQSELVTATEQEIKESIFSKNSHVTVFVAENNKEEVLGFALIFKTYSTFKATSNYYVEDLFVFPEYRGKGIGSLLLGHIKEYAQKQRAKKVEWYVNKQNKGAIDFYHNFGAKELDYKSIYYLEV